MEIDKARQKLIRTMSCVVVCLLLLFGVFCIIYSATELPYMGKYALGSGFLPLWVGIFIVVLSLVILINTLRGKYDKFVDIIPKRKNAIAIILYIAISCVTIALLRVLGMHICCFIFLFSTMILVEKHNWKFSLVTAVVGSISIYIFFDLLFNVNFPSGIFGF